MVRHLPRYSTYPVIHPLMLLPLPLPLSSFSCITSARREGSAPSAIIRPPLSSAFIHQRATGRKSAFSLAIHVPKYACRQLDVQPTSPYKSLQALERQIEIPGLTSPSPMPLLCDCDDTGIPQRHNFRFQFCILCVPSRATASDTPTSFDFGFSTLPRLNLILRSS